MSSDSAASRLSVRALGGLDIRVGQISQPLQRKPQELLAILLASRGTLLSSDVLIDQLWAGAPPASAGSAIRVYLTKLRSALEPGRGAAPSSRLARSAGGWALRLEEGELDIGSFESAVGEASVLQEAGRHESAWSAHQAAARCWTGDPFPDVDIRLVNAERRRLQAVRADALRTRTTLAIELGFADLVLGDLREARRHSPYDEQLAVLHARAEYSVGRHVDALETLRAHRRTLDDELGLDAGEAVRDLEQRILRHDAAVRLVPRLPPRSAFSTTGLLGRDDLLVRLQHEVADHQVVAVTGEAGIGKTSLLRALEPSFGVRAVATCSVTAGPLAVIRDLIASMPHGPRDNDAWRRFRTALDARTAAEEDPAVIALLAEDLLVDVAADRDVVALLDDAHLLDVASAQVLTRALAARPRLHLILARRPVEKDGAAPSPRPGVVVTVPPLDDEAARQLLTRFHARRAANTAMVDAALIADAGGNPWLLERSASAGNGQSGSGQRALVDLTEAAQELALTLAAIASDIPVTAAVRLTGHDRPVEELLVKRVAILEEGRIRLRHDLIAQDVRRQAGALKVAATVRALMPRCAELGLLPLDLRAAVGAAEHLLDDEAAASWALAAATQAMEAGGLEEAQILFDSAVRRAGSRADLRAPAQLGQAQALTAAGRLADARPIFVAAMQDAQTIGADLLVKQALVGLLGMLAPSDTELAVLEKVSVWLTQRSRLSDADLLEVLDARAAAASEIDMALVEARAVELSSAARRVGTPLAALYDLLSEWRLSQERGAPSRERLPISTSAVELAAGLGQDALLVRVLRNHIDDLLAGGLRTEADRAVERLAALGREKRLPQARWWVDVLAASAALRADAITGLAAAHVVHNEWSRLPSRERDDALMIQSLVALFQTGDHRTLLESIRRVRAARRPARRSLLLPAAEVAAAAEGGLITAETYVEYAALVATIDTKPRYWLDPPTWYLLARAGLAMGKSHPVVIERLERHSASWMLVGTATATLGPVDGVLAALAMTIGDEALANDRLAAAIMLCEQMGAPSRADECRILVERSRRGPAI